MLRINLLPAYIAERRKVRNAIVISTVLWLAVLGAGLGYNFVYLSKQITDKKAEADEQETKATAETAYEAETTKMLAVVKPLQEKVDFVKQDRWFNTLTPRIYRNAAAYTYKQVEYDSMVAADKTLSVHAYCPSIPDIAKFYILMFGNPDVTAVSINGVPTHDGFLKAQPVTYPGGPPPTKVYYPVALTATLVKPIVPPTLPASLTGGTGAPGGAPGISGGAPSAAADAPIAAPQQTP